MKSKISFFNKTIFKKNITLYWPIWAGYLLVLLVIQPIMLWSNFHYGKFFDEYTTQMKFEDAISTLTISLNGWVIVFAAVLVGMALYSYIYNAKSANMIHALPVDRAQLFGTNVISGLAFLIVPQIVAAIASAGVCLGYGMNRLDIIGIALIESIAVAFVAYAIVTFCAMFTGLLVALPLYVLVIEYLAKWVYYMIYLVVNLFAYGTTNLGSKIQTIFEIMLAPFSALGGYIGFKEIYEDQVCVGMEIFGGELLAIYVAISVVLYVLAYFTYKKRHIEQAGEWITVEWLKPVFRFGAGMTAGIYGGMFIYIMLEQINIRLGGVALIILMVLLGSIGFFLAEMLLRKNFHVFHKKTWMRCGIFSVILLLSYGGLRMVAEYAEKYVPEKEEVLEVSIHMGYDIDLDGEMADRAIDIHKIIIENIDEIEAEAEAFRSDTDPFQYFYISYRLKNGDYVDRHYSLYAVNEDVQTIMKELAALEANPEIFLQNKFCKRYDEVTVFGEGHMELVFAKNVFEEEEGYTTFGYDTLVFAPEQTKELYAAAIADVRSGNLIRYNSNSEWTYEEMKEYTTVSLYLSYQDPDDTERETVIFSENSAQPPTEDMIVQEYEHQKSVYLSIGKDCENVLNKLIEFGFIASVDDIYWGE